MRIPSPLISLLALGFGAAAPAGGLDCPDGTTLELAEVPVEADRIAHVNVNCSDLARSAEWYERVLGLKPFGSSAPGPVPGAAFGIEGEVEWDARFLLPAGLGIEDTLAVDLLEWKRPAPVGTPYPEGHHLGLYRMAFLVTDVREAREELLRQGVDAPEPVWLDMGPEIPVDGVEALFFPDPDGTCLELIQVPTVTAP